MSFEEILRELREGRDVYVTGLNKYDSLVIRTQNFLLRYNSTKSADETTADDTTTDEE